MTEEVPTKTYEITAIHGRYRITVPATWKITFGAIVPGKGGGSSSGSYGVRVWEATEKQRFVMDGVTSFHDVSIPMQRLAVRKYGSEEWYSDETKYRGKKAETVERNWVDVDLVNEGTPPVDEDDDPIPFESARKYK